MALRDITLKGQTVACAVEVRAKPGDDLIILNGLCVGYITRDASTPISRGARQFKRAAPDMIGAAAATGAADMTETVEPVLRGRPKGSMGAAKRGAKGTNGAHPPGPAVSAAQERRRRHLADKAQRFYDANPAMVRRIKALLTKQGASYAKDIGEKLDIPPGPDRLILSAVLKTMVKGGEAVTKGHKAMPAYELVGS